MLAEDRVFYRSWILANGWAEAVGLGTTFALGQAVAPWFEAMTSILAALAGAVVAVALGIVLEGLVVGFAQERVLRRRFPHVLPPGSWIIATAVGAGLAWMVGMFPSTMMALANSKSPTPLAPAPGPLVQSVMAAALGLVAGPILGVVQWIALRRLVSRAGYWLWANAVAWAVGMPVIFLGMDLVPWSGGPVVVLGVIYLVCGCAGLVVGAIHGWILVGLMRSTES